MATINLISAPKIISKKLLSYPLDNLQYFFDPFNNYITSPLLVVDYSNRVSNSTIFNASGPQVINPSWNYNSLNLFNEYADIGSVSDFNFIHQTREFSIIYWARSKRKNFREPIYNNTGSRAENGFLILHEYLSGNGLNVLKFDSYRSVAGTTVNTGTTDDETINQDDLWHLYCYVPYGDIVGQWYIDGEKVNTTARYFVANTNGQAPSAGNATRTMYLGRVQNTSLYGSIYIGESLFYNISLTEQDIRYIYHYNIKKYK